MTGWTCYECGGAGHKGTEVVRLYTAEELVKLNARQEKARLTRDAKRAAKAAARKAESDARVATFTEANNALVEAARANMGASPFLADLIAKLEEGKVWTDRQIAAVEKSIAETIARAATRAASGYVGKVGERIEAAVTVEFVASFVRPSFRGFGTDTVRITTMRDAAGNALVVKSASFWVEKGDKFPMRATVKEHSEYRGEKQTVMMRAAILQAKTEEKT
jgi:hypothetical protein